MEAGSRQVPDVLKHHLRQTDLDEIARVVDSVESKTAAEIRVHINHSLRFWQNSRKRAIDLFYHLGMDGTAGHTGLLLFLSLKERRIEIVSDTGIESRIPGDSWTNLVKEMQQQIHQKGLVTGICFGIDQIGRILSPVLPRSADDRNELPNTVSQEP